MKIKSRKAKFNSIGLKNRRIGSVGFQKQTNRNEIQTIESSVNITLKRAVLIQQESSLVQAKADTTPVMPKGMLPKVCCGVSYRDLMGWPWYHLDYDTAGMISYASV